MNRLQGARARTLSDLAVAAAVLCVSMGCSSTGTRVLAFQSLAADVEVRRDERGVPHVFAKDGNDALFGLGYATAEDRLFQLDINRRQALGRMAELLGDASLADDRLARTIGLEAVGAADAKDLLDHDPEVYRALSAYAAGVSAFIADASSASNGAKLPPEYADIDPSYRPEPWKVEDTLSLLKAELFLLAAHPETDLVSYAMTLDSPNGPAIYRDLYEPDPLEKVYVTEGFPDCTAPAAATSGSEPVSSPGRVESLDAGRVPALLELASALARFSRRHRIGPVGASNNWALCGRLTRSGAPMLANDPHLPLELPTNMYEFHLESDDSVGAPGPGVHMAGFGIPGAPAVLLGHNQEAAWGVTTVEADIADSYLETTQGDAVVFRGQVVPMVVRTETIRVRRPGRPVSDFDEVTQTVRVVPHHGPVLSDAVPSLKLILGDDAISMRWGGFGVTHEARAFYDLSRATSYLAWKAALDHFQSGLLNFVYAGTDGDIGYYPHADYPIRARLDPMNPPYGVMPGTGDYEWTGALIPNDCIPQLYDPAACRVFTANNDPAGVTANRDVLGAKFYLGGTFDYGLRARRIQDRLDELEAAGHGATLDDFASMQADVHSGLADHFLPPLLAAAAGAKPSATASAMVKVLATWDKEDTTSAVAPTIFYAFYAQLLVDVFADDLPLTFSLLATDDRIFATALRHILAGAKLPSGYDYLEGKQPNDVLLASLEKIATTVPSALGNDLTQWAWGRAHTNTFDHPLGGRYDLGPVAMGGGLSSLNAARYSPTVNGVAVVTPDVFEGPNARVAIELVPGNITMQTVLPTGESGVLGDPHYADQLDAWLAVHESPSPFRPEDVAAHAPIAVVYPAGFPER